MTLDFIIRHIKVVRALVFFLALGVFSFIGLIIYDTLVTDHPFKSQNTRANVRYSSGGDVIFQYWCEMTAFRRVHARAARFVAHSPSGKIIDLGVSERIYEPKVTPVYREFTLGPKEQVEKGEWCFSATMFYQPDFSIKTHYYQTPRTCIHVQ